MQRQGRGKGTQERILAAAVGVFAEHGFRDATTRQICAAAGVNVSLVNYYFRSKADLFKAVVTEVLREVAEPMGEVIRRVHDEESWKEALRYWVRKGMEMCAALKPPESYVARMIGHAELLPDDMRRELDERFRKPMMKGFNVLLGLGLPDDDPLTVQIWACSVNAQTMVYALAQPGWVHQYCPEGVSLEEWFPRMVDHICEGIFARLTFRPERLGTLAALD